MEPIRSVTVIGAGTMGAGIAQAVALAGIAVWLHDVDGAALDKGVKRARAQIDDGVARGKVAPDRAERAREGLQAATDLPEAAGRSDLVIEAVPELMDLKKRTFAQLGEVCPAATILATNTSSLSVTEIASVAAIPSRVLGLHFFNPPHIMKLVEIVRGAQTSDDALGRARSFVDTLGKEAIVVRDSPGFATSRLGLALGLEAMRMLEQGVASAADIDRAMELGYGHPMGPLTVSDLVGLDVRLGIAEILHRGLGSDQFRPPEILRDLVAKGRLGKKSGEGFYPWDASGRKRSE